MAIENDLYKEALAEARRVGFALNAQQLRVMQARYLAVCQQFEAIIKSYGPGDRALALDQAVAVARESRKMWLTMERDFATISQQTAQTAAESVVGLHRKVLEQITSAVRQPGLNVALGGTSAKALIASLNMPGAGTFKTVYRRHLVQAVPQIDEMLQRSALAGISSGQVTTDLLGIMTANEPAVLARLPSASTLHRGGFGKIDLAKYGMIDADVSKVRTMLYDARRIAVSQTNNTLRESNRQSMLDGGLVLAAKWQTSGRHSTEDACDILAQANVYGYGPGMYPPEHWPFAPHPHCGCMQGGPVRTRRPSEWKSPKPDPPPAAWKSFEHRQREIAEKNNWSEARQAAQKGMARSSIRVGKDPNVGEGPSLRRARKAANPIPPVQAVPEPPPPPPRVANAEYVQRARVMLDAKDSAQIGIGRTNPGYPVQGDTVSLKAMIQSVLFNDPLPQAYVKIHGRNTFAVHYTGTFANMRSEMAALRKEYMRVVGVKTKALRELDEHFSSWAGSSNSVAAGRLKRYVEEKHGGVTHFHSTYLDHDAERRRAYLLSQSDSMRADVEKALEADHAFTAALIEWAGGGRKIKLFRGVRDDFFSMKGLDRRTFPTAGTMDINTVSSWSTSAEAARNFGPNVFSIEVDADDVLADFLSNEQLFDREYELLPMGYKEYQYSLRRMQH